MSYLAKQTYIKMERKGSGFKQIDQEDYRTLYLYEESLVTHYRVFRLKEIINISYYGSGLTYGLLYVQTTRGLFTYFVKGSPHRFIQTYEKHIASIR